MRNISIGIFLTFAFALFAQNLFVIDFQSETVGKPPTNWKSKSNEDISKVYSIQEEEGGNRFLRADSKGESISIGYEKEWSLGEYPIISWRWRANVLPKGTDERKKSGNDDVLGMYVIFGGWPVPKSIKYIWSETLPVGTVLDSPFSGKTKMMVLCSGEEGLGEWFYEERNILEDYNKLFGSSEKDIVAKGIAILTDSDNAKTTAMGDYDDITIKAKSK